MYSQQRIFSAKMVTFDSVPVGAFDDLKTISMGVWSGLLCVIGVLTVIDIFDTRVKGIPKSIMAVAADKLILYFGAILGKGFDIPSSLAIRFSVGVYLLIIVVFVNLFNGVLKANFSSQKRENINSIEDLLKVPDVTVYISDLVLEEVKRSDDDEIKTLWQRATKKHITFSREILSGKEIWFGDLSTLQSGLIQALDEDEPKPDRWDFHLGSAKYFHHPLVYPENKEIDPEAMKYINRRLRAFFETGQETRWLRFLERDWHVKVEPHRSTVENELHKIKFQDIAAKLALGAAMIGVASLVLIVEILTLFKSLASLG